MTTAALQPYQLKFKLDVDQMKPLIAIKTVASAMNEPEDDILKLKDFGALGDVWNIGSAQARRSEWRFLTVCVAAHILEKPVPEFGWPELLPLLIPHYHPAMEFVEASGLMAHWSARPELGVNLIEQGSLKLLAGCKPRRGRGGAALVTRASVVEFLKTRRVQ